MFIVAFIARSMCPAGIDPHQFRTLPDSNFPEPISRHVEAVTLHPDDPRVRPGLRDRLGRPFGDRLQLAVGAADKSLNDLVRQNPLAVADLADIMSETSEIIHLYSPGSAHPILRLEGINVVQDGQLPKQDLADTIILTASVKIAPVPVLPAGGRFAKYSSSSLTRTTNGFDSIPFWSHGNTPQRGGVYGSGVPMEINGYFLTLASNSPTIFNTGPKIQLSVICLSCSSRGLV
jgi:hypothetical protein